MTITVTGGPAYGVAWNKTADTYARVASAAGLTAGASFDAIAPWTMRRCNLWDDGTPTAYYGDRCYTDVDVANMGQCMVKIPKFYYYMEYDVTTTAYYWFITTDAAATIDVGLGVGAQAVKLHPAFSRNSVTKDYIYVGAYEAYYNAVDSLGRVNILESKAGVPPTVTHAITAFRTAAQLRVPGGTAPNKWEIEDYLTHSAVQLLFLIEYGSFRSQAVLGKGITNDAVGTIHTTGDTTIKGNTSYGTTAYTVAVSYRGIENLWGNINQLLDGINVQWSTTVGIPWIADHGFVCNTFASPYVTTAFSLPTTNNAYISDISTSAAYDYSFFPSAVAGALGTYLGDKFMSPPNASWCGGVYVSGCYQWADAAGAFMFDAAIPYTLATLTDTGARLMYIG